MPDFTIDGDPGAIRSRTTTMRSRGIDFNRVADALTEINTDGWVGRAGDHFRDKFQTEPEKCRQAGDGFTKAAGALEGYADALQTAQQRAQQAAADYARGDKATHDAKNEYDASVSNARNKVNAARAAGQIMQLIIEPFHDPGAAIRQQAIDDFNSAKSDLDQAAHACASEVDASHAGAPNTRDWEHFIGLHTLEEEAKGAWEGLKELEQLAESLGPMGTVGAFVDLNALLTGEMTPRELAEKYAVRFEDAKTILNAARHDPWGFAKTVFLAVADWNTLKDNPAEWAGKLIPMIAVSLVSDGVGGAADEAGKVAQAAGDTATALTENATRAGIVADTADAASESAYATPQILDAADSARSSADAASKAAAEARRLAASAAQHAGSADALHKVLEKLDHAERAADATARGKEGAQEFPSEHSHSQ